VRSFVDRLNESRSKHLKDGTAFVKQGDKVFLRDAVKTPWVEWCSAYEQHLLCPQRRVNEFENDYLALVRAGIATVGVALTLEQRMGKDPRRFELAFV